jgi:hypothetical protein
MTTRHVTDVVRDGHGAAVASATITFKLTKDSYTGAAAYIARSVTATTDEDGAYDAVLWCDEEGVIPTRYQATYPDSAPFKFDLPVGDGSPVLMSSLRAAVPGVAAINLQTYVDLALVALSYNMDGGTPASVYGGTTAINGGTP